MDFTTSGIKTESKSKLSKFLTYGGPQNLKINKIEVETAQTGSKRAVFFMEGKPVETPGWQGEEGAAGQIGRVRTMYMKSDDAYNNFLTDIGIIADKIGNRAQVDAIKANNFDDYIQQLNKYITGKYLWFIVTGEEYPKQDGTTGVVLHFRKYGFVASEAEGSGHLKPFDKTNKWDFRPYVAEDTAKIVDDMPF